MGTEASVRGGAVAVAILSARTLAPEEIGTLGLVVMPVMVVSMLGSYFETAGLVARGPFTEATRCTAGLILRLLTACAAVLVVAFFHSPLSLVLLRSEANVALAQHLALILAALPFIEALTGYPLLWLQRHRRIASAAVPQSVQAVTYGVVGCLALLGGFGVTGLAVVQVSAALLAAGIAWFYLRGEKETLFLIDRQAALAILREGLRQTMGGLGGFLSERTDNLLLAARLGPGAMSIYSLAWTGSRVPIGIVSRIGRSVLLPQFATAANGDEVFRTAVEALRRGFLFSTLAALISASVGEELTVFVLGERWRHAGECLQLMSGSIFLAPLLFVGVAMVQHAGRAHLLVAASGLQITLQFALIPTLADTWGPKGVAALDVLSTFAATCVVLLVSGNGRKLALAGLKQLAWPLFFAGVTGASVLSLSMSWVATLLLLPVAYGIGVLAHWRIKRNADPGWSRHVD